MNKEVVETTNFCVGIIKQIITHVCERHPELRETKFAMQALVQAFIQNCLYLNSAAMGLEFNEFYNGLMATVQDSKDQYDRIFAEFTKLEQSSKE